MTLEGIVNLILSALIGIGGYFIKRTISDVDKARNDISCIEREYATKKDVQAVEREVESVKLEYTPRADFEKLENKIDRVTDSLHEVQLKSVSKEDFFIKMSELASTLERMEDKMERYRDGK